MALEVASSISLRFPCISFLFLDPDFFWIYTAALAAAAADTWSTELGTRFGRNTRSIASLRKVAPGTSGGVSVVGFLGSFAGAATVWLAAALVAGWQDATFTAAMIVGGGCAGSIIDSILGATIQGRFRDPDGQDTEAAIGPAGESNTLVGGLRWVTNDTINIIGSASGALIACLILYS